MSENLVNEKVEFFNNKDIPDAVKLGAVCILMGGTYELYTAPNGKTRTFVSTVFKKGGNK